MSTFIQTLDKFAPRDNPAHWADKDVIAQPDFDLQKFQQRVNDIVGLTPEHKEIVRVRWAWNEDCFSLFYTAWDIENLPTKSELKAKYLYRTVEIEGGETLDIPPPRFVFEERIEPAQYYDSWEQNRWQYDASLGRKVPLRPRAPRDGYYRFLFYVAAHDLGQKCCERAQNARAECFGLYREPAEKDLNLLRRVKHRIHHATNRVDPYKPFDAATLEQIFKETESAARDEEQRKLIRDEETSKEFEEILAPLSAYSFAAAAQLPNEKMTKGGIIIPG